MKRFMFLSIGVLCLSVSAMIGFHLGGRTVQAQATSSVVGFVNPWSQGTGNNYMVMLDNGDVYGNDAGERVGNFYRLKNAPLYLGNFWGGQPVPVSPSTIGSVKAQYKEE